MKRILLGLFATFFASFGLIGNAFAYYSRGYGYSYGYHPYYSPHVVVVSHPYYGYGYGYGYYPLGGVFLLIVIALVVIAVLRR
jgi:hypothetical protein